MSRTRQIGITEKQKEQLLKIDRLPRDAQMRLAYDLREIVDKALEDLDFVFRRLNSIIKGTVDSTTLSRSRCPETRKGSAS